MKLKPLLFSMLVLLIASCTRYRDILYLQPSAEHKADSSIIYPSAIPIYRIQKNDLLYIRITSMNKEATELINSASKVNDNALTSGAGYYIYGYSVNDSGLVDIPVIGKIYVLGLTLEQAKYAVLNQSLKFLKDPTIKLGLLSFKYSVLGEVNRPGMYQNYNNQLTVLEAISQAGDISIYGNRKKIVVVRPGVKETQLYHIDLTSIDILKSNGFYLLPNDIVYVEPMKSRNFRNNIPVISFTLGTIMTSLLILNTFNIIK
jgi:polysaccharide biosynthesis/export protein